MALRAITAALVVVAAGCGGGGHGGSPRPGDPPDATFVRRQLTAAGWTVTGSRRVRLELHCPGTPSASGVRYDAVYTHLAAGGGSRPRLSVFSVRWPAGLAGCTAPESGRAGPIPRSVQFAHTRGATHEIYTAVNGLLLVAATTAPVADLEPPLRRAVTMLGTPAG